MGPTIERREKKRVANRKKVRPRETEVGCCLIKAVVLFAIYRVYVLQIEPLWAGN